MGKGNYCEMLKAGKENTLSELRQSEKVEINESEGAVVISLCATSMRHVLLEKRRW